MSDKSSLINLLESWFGGGVTTLIGAILGRAMHHQAEVRYGRRKMIGKEVIWELPIAVGMALIGESLAAYLGIDSTVRVGLIAALSYLGPRGAEAILTRYLPAKKT